ncbi:transposase [Streptomyces sp. NBC_01190]|nr:transposase [Streptomyces sp. NBC_01190]
MSLPNVAACPCVESLAVLSEFRTGFYACLTARADALFELTDAVLCTGGPVRSLVDLALAPEHRRGHGALYDGLNRGGLDVARLRRILAGLPRAASGRLVLAVDVSPWLRPDAATVPDRSFCHTYGRGNAKHQMMPGWPYSVDRLHPRLTRRAAWLDHDGPLPIIEGTVIRLAVEHLPSGGVNKPVWLWWSSTGATEADVDRCWQAFLRRFDIEPTFRMLKQTLGWTRPRLRDSAAADRWTWLIIAAHTQFRLARPLATDLRRPWEKAAPPHKLTPARVRRGFRHLRTTAGRLSHGLSRWGVKSDFVFGFGHREDVGVWAGGAELPAVRP